MKHAQPPCARCTGPLTEAAGTYTVPAIQSATNHPAPGQMNTRDAELSPELTAIHRQIAHELGFTPATLPPTLEAAQVAVVLGVSPGTLEQWRSASAIAQRPDNPVLPFQKIGRSLRYPVWHLARFILQHTYRRSGEPLFTDQPEVSA